jgi:hypothetical protein
VGIVMKTAEGPEESDRGTPRDYKESMYRFYLELADRSPTARGIIEAFLPQHHAARIVELDYGFEFEMPIQVAPDLIRALAGNNIAVYQLVRFAKTKGHWRNHAS